MSEWRPSGRVVRAVVSERLCSAVVVVREVDYGETHTTRRAGREEEFRESVTRRSGSDWKCSTQFLEVTLRILTDCQK